MGSRKAFYRKIVYAVAIGLLLMPIYQLSKPPTDATKTTAGSPGGKLSQLRDQYHLSQSQLGQVDPSSVTIKLATLGMRGVAANILWTKADEYQMKKDWTNRSAVLTQITKVQPNFINVWINQSWNLAYNISAQFDDYRDRYRWVMRGIDFMKEGIKYNEREPRLPYEVGWTVSHKIGKADEYRQFRKLFKEDDDFNGSLPLALRDNWLVGRDWYEHAAEMVDTQGLTMMGKSPQIYRSAGPMCQMYYGSALEKDGVFGEVAKRAWATAGELWRHFGTEEIPTSFQDEKTQQPIAVRLGDREMHEQESKKCIEQLTALQPGLREKLVAEKRAGLTKAMREALDMPAGNRSGRQNELAQIARDSIEVTYGEVARRITGPNRKEALRLAEESARQASLAYRIGLYRQIVNFDYWRLRAEIEQTDDMLGARQQIHQGNRSYAESDLIAARDAYNRGLLEWRKVLDRHQELLSQDETIVDLKDIIKQYRQVLSQLDEPFPEKFILQDVVDTIEKSEAAQGLRRE